MQKLPNQDSQPQNQLYLSLRSLNLFLLNAVVVSTVILGTTRILTQIFKSPKIFTPAVGVETAVKPPIVSEGNQPISNDRKTRSHPTDQERQQPTNSAKPTLDASKMHNTLVANLQPQNQNNQQLLNNQTRWSKTRLRRSLLTFNLINDKQPPPDLVRAPSQSVSKEESPINFQLTTDTQGEQTQAAALISQNQFPKVEKKAENSLKQNQQESLQNAGTVALKLSDIVVLALQNNRTIKNSYLERIAQRQDLAVAEDKFAPDFTPSLSMSVASSESSATTTTNEAGLEAKMKIPTGGELSFGFAGNALTPKISFNQPLLRGAGVDVNRASIKTARLTEKSNVLGLKSTLTNTITDAILAYRNLLRAQEQLKIEQLSLKSAQEILEINQALIAAGRLAPVEIIQSQTAIANRQVSLVAAQNSLQSTKLALLQVLDIDQNTNIVAAEVPKASPVTLDQNKIKQLALLNQPEYLQAQLNQDIAKLNLLEAENNRRWDLGLNISYDNAGNNATPDVRAGLIFSKTLGDLTVEQTFQRSRVNLLQTENNLNEQRESLDIQVTDGIRDVNLSFKQVELAGQARESSERQLEIEREKQRLGRGSGVFEIVSLENSLVEARNAELNATIEYLNALTNLDKTVGTTLNTWQITIERNQN
ncbi:TolC family protein [Nostoc sphaeroides CHAB 2801]|uniref:TolC family protein n=1 Tax=Nostoc sphaeroides TaxID=446679 RepID=UPI000E52EA45|nr:TolC family protein [Nostoc sphaeroides]MCC5627217.1 TolC family protein [Nostoc sphaeroides CHAB 2801]